MQRESTNKIAKERIEILFNSAEKALQEEKENYSKRYISLARKIGSKSRTRLPLGYKKKFCKVCNIFWIPGKTLRVRLQRKEKKLIYTCLSCGAIKRYPLIKNT